MIAGLSLADDVASDAQEVFASTLPWSVLHVRSRTEKVVFRKLSTSCLSAYLPLRERVQKYQRRQVRTELPIFPGYVFLRADEESARFFAGQTREIVSYLNVFDQSAIDESMRSLEKMLQSGLSVTPEERLEPGRQVEIIRGPLTGLRGRVIKKMSSLRFVLGVDIIRQGASVEVDESMIEPV